MKNPKEKKQKWPEAPAHLSEKAKKLFSFYVGKTIKTPGQIALFIQGLEAMDRADEAGKLIREQGLFQTSERSGMSRQNPLLNSQKEAATQMLKIWKVLRLQINQRTTENGYEDLV